MKLKIPSNLNDITLHQYQRYNKELENHKNDPNANEVLKIKKIEIFCNLSNEQVLMLEYGSVENISNILDEILQQQPSLIDKFTLNGIKFGLVPELDKLTYGALLDLNTNISYWNTMHVAMGVIFRPIKNEIKNGLYNVEKYKGEKYHDILKYMPLSVVIASMVFFWNLGMDCATYILKSLEEETDFHSQLNLTENGIGIQQSMNSLTAILQNMKL